MPKTSDTERVAELERENEFLRSQVESYKAMVESSQASLLSANESLIQCAATIEKLTRLVPVNAETAVAQACRREEEIIAAIRAQHVPSNN